MENISKRLKSKVVWVAVLSQVLLIIGILKPEISDNVKIIAGSVIEILTLFGILNNPTTNEEF